MSHSDCVSLLQWTFPRLGLRWKGYRKVHRQVCKRLRRRIQELGLENLAAYRERLAVDAAEWRDLDGLCHITVSRFFRDRGVFNALSERVLPDIAARAAKERRRARCWSAGCASGEEPYTVKILWDLAVAPACGGIACSIVATDVDRAVLERAWRGYCPESSLRDMPETFVTRGFDRFDDLFCVRSEHREVRFLLQDLRCEAPEGCFDLILCRNVAFTYFDLPLQKKVLKRLLEHLTLPGYLVIGSHERLPELSPYLLPPQGCAADLRA